MKLIPALLFLIGASAATAGEFETAVEAAAVKIFGLVEVGDPRAAKRLGKLSQAWEAAAARSSPDVAAPTARIFASLARLESDRGKIAAEYAAVQTAKNPSKLDGKTQAEWEDAQRARLQKKWDQNLLLAKRGIALNLDLLRKNNTPLPPDEPFSAALRAAAREGASGGEAKFRVASVEPEGLVVWRYRREMVVSSRGSVGGGGGVGSGWEETADRSLLVGYSSPAAEDDVLEVSGYDDGVKQIASGATLRVFRIAE